MSTGQAIDYEAEYNNRVLVPEHPAIIAGWARDAAAYRDAAGDRFSTIPYGPGERCAIDLFAPKTESGGAIVVFIHGGYWQGLDRSSFSHMARGLNAHGISVAVPGYDLCPNVRMGEIVDQSRAACRRLGQDGGRLGQDGGRLVVSGHSAGGHLAACMLATDWRALDPALPDKLVAAAYAISGLFELKPLIPTSINEALGLDEPEAERLSPISWTPPRGRIMDAVVGADETDEFQRQSRAIVERWGKSGVATRFEAIPRANHFTVVAPLANPDSGMVKRLADFARGAGSR